MAEKETAEKGEEAAEEEAPAEEKPAKAKRAAKKAPPKKAAAEKEAAPEKEADKKAPAKTAAKKAAAKKVVTQEKKEAAKEKTAAKKAGAKKREESTGKPAKKAAPKKKAAKKKPAKKAEKPAAEAEPEAPKEEAKPAKKKKEPAEEAPPIPPELLLFGRWDLSEVDVADPGLARYINLEPTFLPHSGGRWANRPYSKARVNIVERLVNHMMRTEKYTGKKGKTIQVVQRAFEEVERRAKRHPVQVLVDGLQSASPREEITRLRFGGISVPRAVDIAPARRLDLAIRHLTVGAVRASYKNRKPIWKCLADEMLMAADADINSYAVGKKEEMERIAASAR